ncbi:MAG: virulence-associated E family protein [Bacillota bacterium]|nr:virulence-associated E family protein [Bacillota bacterium]
MNTENKKSVESNVNRKIYIATGRSRKETKWKNIELSYKSLLDKLKETTRTRETFKEYKSMSKTKKDDIKDVGGFVGGSLKGGRRKAENLANRSIITLDMDNVDVSVNDLWDGIIMLNDYEIVMYSTHSHSSDNPRLRLVLPLSRSVLPDEYQAISRKLAEEIGIDMFDDTTYEPSRLMYWPSTSSDGEFIFKRQEGNWLDVEEYLDKYLDWKDTSFWPESSRQSVRIQSQIKKQEDPLEKRGIIGAFCKTYPISAAIDTFLSDVYTATNVEGRYTYLEGSTVGGLVVYDDKFAYSHHGTDPVSGMLCNAFDLVRIHKFGIKDEDAKDNTPANRLPSFTAMSDMASRDEEVKSTLGSERYAEVIDDFDLEDEEEELDLEWLKKVNYDKRGKVVQSIRNVIAILENDPRLKGRIAFNEFANRAVIKGALPWNDEVDADWKDSDDAGLRYYLENTYEITHANKIDDGLKLVWENNTFHPVREYLNSLEWDGVERLDTVLIDYLGANDNEYVRMVTRRWMMGAVARIFVPGIKFDYMLVLSGAQGIMKSTFLNIIAKDWFTDSIQTVEGNQAIEKLMNSWIIEFGELQALSKSETNAVKRFITSQEDRTRLAYARRTSYLKRQCVFAGTTNKSEFLKDDTGNRRYWPVEVKVEGRTKSIPKDLKEELDQIWAEAVVLWKSKKERLYLTKEEEKVAKREQEAHRELNEKEGVVLDYLETLLPEDWEDMDLYQRRDYLQGADFLEGTMIRDKVCVLEIWCECFEKKRSDLRKSDSLEINAILNSIGGWSNSDKKMIRSKLYGPQRFYIRTD